MKKEEPKPHVFESISDAHRAFGLPKPRHPLISLVGSHDPGLADVKAPSGSHVLNFYKVSYRPKLSGRLKYGQHYYDFDEGGLLFASPGQLIGSSIGGESSAAECSLYTLLIHPDFLLGHPLSKKIRQYGFFSYSVNEALHLSETEMETVVAIFRMIGEELNSRIDEFSQDVVISQIELLLNYANRFCKRQFITRKAVSNGVLQQLDDLLGRYFDQDLGATRGLPTVQYLASQVNLSPSYLSDMLRSLIGQNAQQYIHTRLIDKAKEKLSTTSLTVSEVAYELGFEHSQSFCKLFKTKTTVSPSEFRRRFN
ncbi:MAG: helix-turn-helix transcriptional regulator [Bacteroidetes bacterium]|nr:helix-turn-helix transcriptional regulator [Bacteroidota bacterium]